MMNILPMMDKNQQLILLVILSLLLTNCVSSQKALEREYRVNLIISNAKSYTGTPYRYGGTTRTGMDCSALLYNSFNSIDVALPRVSKEQSKVGKKVSFEKLKPGDLVFFSSKKGKRKIVHAGLVTKVTSEKTQFIHASTKLGVVESNLRSNYYKGIFVKARRVF